MSLIPNSPRVANSNSATTQKTTSRTLVSTGIVSEEKKFEWKIENFDYVRKSDTLINSQRFEFQAGGNVGIPCTFICFLDRCTSEPARKIMGMYYQLKEKPAEFKDVNVSFRFEIMKEDGIGNVFRGTVEFWNLLEYTTKDWGFRVKEDQLFPLVNGNLVIHTTFKVFAPAASPRLIRLNPTAPPTGICSDLANLLKDDFPFSDVTIVSKDGTEFQAHRCILAVRSPVFRTMFEANLSETQTGTVSLNDLSGAAVKVMLTFMYTSTLLPQWSQGDIVVELTYAAEKYELKELLVILDRELGKICTIQNVGKLIVLAKKLSLKKAEKELAMYVKSSPLKDVFAVVEHALE